MASLPRSKLVLLLQSLLLSSLATAQFPPPREGITLLKSRFHENITISFKEVRLLSCHPLSLCVDGAAYMSFSGVLTFQFVLGQPHICETTPGVKSYSGYVHLPPGTLDDGTSGGEKQDYPINT